MQTYTATHQGQTITYTVKNPREINYLVIFKRPNEIEWEALFGAADLDVAGRMWDALKDMGKPGELVWIVEAQQA